MKVNSIASFPTLLRLALGEARDLNPSLLAESVPYPQDPLLSLYSGFSPSTVHTCALIALNYILMDLENSTQMGL